MTEQQVETPEIPAQTAEEPSPIESIAMKLGWNPDFEGDNAVDAETYIMRSRDISDGLSKQVRSLKKELGAMREGIEVIKYTTEKSYQKEMDRLKTEIGDLKSQRTQAIKDGDADAVGHLDSRIDVLQKASRDTAPPRAAGPPPEYFEWVEENEWYLKDPELHGYVDSIIGLPENKALPYPRLLQKVTRMAKSEFPDKFVPATPKNQRDVAPANPSAPSVSPSRQRAKPPRVKATHADLSYSQVTVGKEFVSMGLYKNLDEYAEKLAEQQQGAK